MNKIIYSIVALLVWTNVTFAQTKPKEKEEDEEKLEESLEDAKQKWFKLMHKPNANYFKIKKKYDNYFSKKHEGESGPREYGLSWLKTNLYYLDSKGRVQNRPQFYDPNVATPRLSAFPTVTDTVSGDWYMIGPRKIRNNNNEQISDNGGYAYCIKIDPNNTNRLACAFVTGGLWTSINNGVSWHLADANLPASTFHDIDFCKANANIIYAISSFGVIKSTDGGLTFNATTLTNQTYSGTAYDIAVSPTNENLVLARWADKIYKTTDGGTTWTSVKTGLKNFTIFDSNNNGEVLDWDVNSNSVFFTDRNDNQNYVDLYKSTDDGATFTLLKKLTLAGNANGQITGWSKICTATNNKTSVTVFVGSGADVNSHRAAHMYKVVIATGNITTTRTNMVDGLNTDYGSPTMLHHGDIAMDINDENKIIHGGYSSGDIQYSSNNGVSFTPTAGIVHSDVRTLSMVNGKMFVGTDGGAGVSTDLGVTYAKSTNSISNHELWGFGSASKSDFMAVGCNHGPLMVRYKGEWQHILGADQGNTDINPLDSTTVYSQGYDSYHVTINGSMDYSNSYQQVDPGGIYSYFNTMEFHPYKYHTLVTHHAGQYPSDVAQATKDIWKKSLIRSDDNGKTVRVIYTFADQLFREKMSFADTNRIYAVVGLTNSKLMKSINGGKTWTDITPTTSVTGASVRNISDIAVSDANADEIWVTYSGVQNTCKVLYSANGGTAYTNLTQSVLTTSPITKIAFQRGTNGGVYVGNATGVYYKNKTMSNWVELGTGLPDVDVRFMFVNTFRNKLLIGTNRGGWEHDLYEASATKAFITVDNSNPDCNEPVVSFRDNSTVTNSASGVKYNWSFPGGTPSTSTLECPKVSYKNATPGNYSVSLTVTDKNGSNTQTLTNFITYTKGNLCCQDVTNNWTLKELGSNTLKGAVCYTPVNDNYKFTTKTAGFDNVYDSIPFVYQILTGDGDIIAKVTSLSNDWNYTGGVMIRTNLNPNSAYAFVGALDNRGIIDTYRNTNGANSGYLGAKTMSFPMWVKVAKTGNTYKTYYSKDTTTWTLYGTHNLPVATQTYIGITAGNKNCIANMSNVRIKGTVQILTGVNNEVNSSLSIYPNPAENFVNITGLEGINEVRLLDISGVELKTFTTENPDFQINLENYPSGMYLLKVKNASTKNEQIIKVVHQQK